MKIIRIAQEIVVDLRQKKITIPQSTKSSISKEIHRMGDHFDSIPLEKIEDILEEYNIILIQEDGRPWSGMLLGGSECGSDEARDQNARFDLAIWDEDRYKPAKLWLYISWCKLPSGKFEVIKYIS